MMDRRKGIIAILAAWGASVLPKAKAQEYRGQTSDTFLAFSKPPTLELRLDAYAVDDVVLRVTLESKSVELTASEIMEALAPAKPEEKIK